jgi:hypothetical protein
LSIDGGMVSANSAFGGGGGAGGFGGIGGQGGTGGPGGSGGDGGPGIVGGDGGNGRMGGDGGQGADGGNGGHGGDGGAGSGGLIYVAPGSATTSLNKAGLNNGIVQGGPAGIGGSGGSAGAGGGKGVGGAGGLGGPSGNGSPDGAPGLTGSDGDQGTDGQAGADGPAGVAGPGSFPLTNIPPVTPPNQDLQGTGMALVAGAAPDFSGPVATFSDPDLSGAPGSYTATINWGDGVSSPGQITDNGNGNYTVSGSHTYLRSATYSVTVQVSDTSDGGNIAVLSPADFSAPLHSGPPPAHLLDVTTALTTSAEYYTNVIDTAYQRYLGRRPDADGLAYWLGRMQSGLTDEHLEAGFIGSAEYIQNHGGTGEAWVIGMYHDLLGRSPDPDGLAYWLNKLQNGTPADAIAYGFAASAEREGQHVILDYQELLGRTPSQSEIDYWVNLFINGGMTNERVASGFAASAEYYQDHYNDSRDWLFGAYQDLLGRPPDPAGLEHWLEVLQSP